MAALRWLISIDAANETAAVEILDLHAHAGHHLVIGHPYLKPSATHLWCDTCDALVLSVPDPAGCAEPHWMDATFYAARKAERAAAEQAQAAAAARNLEVPDGDLSF